MNKEGSINYRCELLSKTLFDVADMLKEAQDEKCDFVKKEKPSDMKECQDFIQQCIRYAKHFKRT